ncbi:hypothetical protein IFM89_030046 [Coptis chinensis]|uniref:Condensin-2 complex subunit H2 n=1 Tax=Coptis chinensis TaxID=261450 RepID=A0A835ISF5_9MAGN|nr:hypothetical protein IFM89_030046 [Coptis chinensis]
MDTDEPRFHIIQPLKDPESNWAVDVAKNLEEYLIKICSGEVIGENDDHFSINFAEAALMLQGSVQVYSRKVEYLYTLVLHALEFLSQKSTILYNVKKVACNRGTSRRPGRMQQDQTEKTSGQSEGSGPKNVVDDDNEPFLGLDEVPAETKNSLDDGHSKDDTSNLFVKPPANLVVLEGDCFDSIGDVGELESYLLATHDLYRDFILLDPCDVGAVDKYLGEDKAFKGSNVASRGALSRSKTRKSSFQTPTRRSGGGLHKSSLGETLDGNLTRTPEISHNVEFNDNVQINDTIWPDLPAAADFPENDYHEDGTNDGYPEPLDESDDDDDPWKPLNPHEPGDLKVKPFKKVKNQRRQRMRSTKLILLASQLPVARLHGTINPDFKDIWEAQRHETERAQNSQSPPLYEKLRQSLDIRGDESGNPFTNTREDNENNEDENDIPDFGQDDFTMPEVENTFMDAEGPPNHENPDGDFHFSSDDVFQPEDVPSHASLEDLCRSHLDSLLASIAETEKQTELATRVSTWKQRIESTLEEQDSRPPFDIHEYGTRVLDKLSLEEESGNGMSFANVVRGQQKHDVVRTFSALLQLVNNRNVDLERGECDAQPVCYTAVNPFYVRLLSHVKRPEERKFGSRKRVKSPLGKHRSQGNKDKIIQGTFSSVSSPSSELNSSMKSSRGSGDLCVKLGKTIRCTPEGKRRRRSRLVEAVDMQS